VEDKPCSDVVKSRLWKTAVGDRNRQVGPEICIRHNHIQSSKSTGNPAMLRASIRDDQSLKHVSDVLLLANEAGVLVEAGVQLTSNPSSVFRRPFWVLESKTTISQFSSQSKSVLTLAAIDVINTVI